MIELHGKVCVVTGALGLIGRELARALAEAGGRVVVTDLDHGACVDRAHALGGAALGHGADITRREALVSLLAAIVDRYGRIDALINNAAIDDKFGASAARDSMFEHYDLERWRRTLDANVTGTFLCCQVLGGAMVGRGGSIINVASTYGIVAPDQALYRAPDGSQPFFKGPSYPTSKAAVLGFTRYLAAYWGPPASGSMRCRPAASRAARPSTSSPATARALRSAGWRRRATTPARPCSSRATRRRT